MESRRRYASTDFIIQKRANAGTHDQIRVRLKGIAASGIGTRLEGRNKLLVPGGILHQELLHCNCSNNSAQLSRSIANLLISGLSGRAFMAMLCCAGKEVRRQWPIDPGHVDALRCFSKQLPWRNQQASKVGAYGNPPAQFGFKAARKPSIDMINAGA
jgi:hypothetical protein